MSDNMVLIHAGIAVVFLLYLFARLVFSVFGLRDKEYQEIMRKKFRISDYLFFGLLLITGLYPILILGEVELYHLLKILLLGSVFWTSRLSTMNFASASLLGIVILILSGYSSIMDIPKFPRQAGAFENDHPEVIGLSVLEKGRVIFNTICAECHGMDGKKGLFQAADLTASTLTTDQKIEIITNGSPLTVMRSFSKELSENEIKDVIVYIEEELVLVASE